jgi:hypothetical protein
VKSRITPANSPGINTYKKRACNPFRINTCEISRLKTVWNQHLQKTCRVPPPFHRLCMIFLWPLNVPTLQRSTCQRFSLTSLDLTLTQNALASPVDLTLTKYMDLKSRRITLLKEKGGVPLPFSCLAVARLTNVALLPRPKGRLFSPAPLNVPTFQRSTCQRGSFGPHLRYPPRLRSIERVTRAATKTKEPAGRFVAHALEYWAIVTWGWADNVR